jgi:hypothetical protein
MYANIGFLQLIENVSNLIYEITNGGATDSYFCSFSTTPIFIYSNADTDKLQIFKDNKGKSGIYR